MVRRSTSLLMVISWPAATLVGAPLAIAGVAAPAPGTVLSAGTFVLAAWTGAVGAGAGA